MWRVTFARYGTANVPSIDGHPAGLDCVAAPWSGKPVWNVPHTAYRILNMHTVNCWDRVRLFLGSSYGPWTWGEGPALHRYRVMFAASRWAR